MPLSFRNATRDDIAIILTLIYQGAAAPGLVAAPEPDAPATLAAFDAICRDPNQRLVVAEIDGAVVGTLQLAFLPGMANNGAWRGQIESVHIRSDRRGEGLGSEMVRWAVERCRERGCAMVQLTSSALRTDAHRFYERLGFSRSHVGFKMKL